MREDAALEKVLEFFGDIPRQRSSFSFSFMDKGSKVLLNYLIARGALRLSSLVSKAFFGISNHPHLLNIYEHCLTSDI